MIDPRSIRDANGNPPTDGSIAIFETTVNTITQMLEANDVRGPFRAPLDKLGDREIPPNVMKCLEDSLFLEGAAKADKIATANRKAEIHCLAYGRKKGKDAVMSTTPDTNTAAAIATATGTAEVAAPAAPAAKPAKEKKPKAEKAPRAPKAPKLPIHQDTAAQAAKIAQYPWIVPGSFRQDPEKAGGTLVDIKCQDCGELRTIHLADAFQVRYCVACKGKSKKAAKAAAAPAPAAAPAA